MDFTGERMVPGQAPLMLEIAHRARYQFAQELCRGKKVLDFGCGAGYGSQMLSRVADKVLGVDISQEAVDFARSRYSAGNLSYDVRSLEKLAVSTDRYDVVVCFEVIEHLEDPLEFLNKLANVLKDAGMLVISTPNGKDEQNPFHHHGWDTSGFRDLMSREFKNIKIFGQGASAEIGVFREAERLALQRAEDQARRLKGRHPWAKLVPGLMKRWVFAKLAGRRLPREHIWTADDFPIVEDKHDGEIIMAVCYKK
jgi:cyclopropane fatty-acyl-phospholipid synthase-like methyltransferase